jgi:hypothetical protein
MPTCVYCRIEKPLEAFTREHVLPEGFGGFKNTLVLHQEVCGDCNARFGNTLDLALGRSSSEGLERYGWHIKAPEEIVRFKYGEVIIRINAPDSPWHDALVRKIPGPTPGESFVEVIPQAIFQTSDGLESVHVPLWDLRSGKWRSDIRIDTSKGIRILGVEEEYDLVKQALSEQGIEWKEETALGPPPVGPGEMAHVRHYFELTEVLKRAIAKIAMNYVASIYGARAALDSVFDPIRTYIRDGVATTESMFVTLAPETRLAYENEKGEVPAVHYLILEEDRDEGGLVAYVTLFHWAVYRVALATKRPDSLERFESGHLYNLEDLTCYPLRRGRVGV